MLRENKRNRPLLNQIALTETFINGNFCDYYAVFQRLFARFVYKFFVNFLQLVAQMYGLTLILQY